jgi:hypothetical protein
MRPLPLWSYLLGEKIISNRRKKKILKGKFWLVFYNRSKESKKRPIKVAKWLTKLSTEIAYQNTIIDYWASHSQQSQRSNQLQLRKLILHWKDLLKGCKIDLSNIQIGVHLKKLWVFEMFWHPMMRIVDEAINNSKRGYFYKVLEGDLEESKLECNIVSMWAQINEPKQIFSRISC